MTRVSWLRNASSAAPDRLAGSILASEPKMIMEPTYGKRVVPSELNACAKVKRLLAVAGGPSMLISGLATTCTVVMPAARTNSASRKKLNKPRSDAGMNKRQPAVMASSPTVAERMYPMRRTKAAAGMDTMKYAAKNADCTSMTSAFVRMNSAFNFGMITSFKLVMPPKAKNSRNTNPCRSPEYLVVVPLPPTSRAAVMVVLNAIVLLTRYSRRSRPRPPSMIQPRTHRYSPGTPRA